MEKLVEQLKDSLGEGGATDLVGKLKDLQIESERLQGQNINLKKLLARLGKGSEKAACWADSKTERTKNIYDIGITGVGFKIRKRAYPEWSDAKGLPLVDDSVLGKELTESQFKRSIQPIFRWSVDQECRFHVRLFDLTQVSDLKIYKRRRLILEDYFFKFERHNETW